MKKTRPIFVLSLLLCIFLAGCGKTDVATSITSGEKIQINAKADCTLEAVLLADEIDLEGLVGYKKDNSRYLLQIWKIKNTGEKQSKWDRSIEDAMLFIRKTRIQSEIL